MMDHFLAGFGRVDITPEEPTPLAGFGNTSRRFFKEIRDRIYATCVAVSDEAEETVLLYHVDLISLTDEVTHSIRKAVLEQLGIAQDKVMLCCTHTHSAPDLGNTDEPSILRYSQTLPGLFVEAARQALTDRKEAKLFYNSVEVPNMNFVRHYQYVTKDGQVEYFGDGFGTAVINETTAHTTDADPTLYIMKFTRQGGKDIIMANWRAHGVLTGSRLKWDLSADLAGSFREQMEQDLDCLFAFYQGAAGNINPHSRMPEQEEITRDCLVYGRIMARYAKMALENMTEARPGPIRTTQRIMAGKVDHSKDHLIDKAWEIRNIWMQTYNMEKVLEVSLPYGIRTPYQANAIIGRHGSPATIDLELNAICLGPDVGIGTAPNELFDTISVMFEEGSRFPVTLTLGYCGAYRGYIPSKLAYAHTCYESDCAKYAPGIGEEIAENLTEMLNALKED